MIEVSPGFGVLLVAAAAVVVAEAGLTRPIVIAQKAAHSSDRLLLEGILEKRPSPGLMVSRWNQLLTPKALDGTQDVDDGSVYQISEDDKFLMLDGWVVFEDERW